jgi:hypothetical protein
MIIVQLDSEQLSALIQNAVCDAITASHRAEPPAKQPRYISHSEASIFLGLAEQTLYQRKDVPCYRIGKKRLYLESDLWEFVSDHRKKTTQDIEREVQRLKDNSKK